LYHKKKDIIFLLYWFISFVLSSISHYAFWHRCALLSSSLCSSFFNIRVLINLRIFGVGGEEGERGGEMVATGGDDKNIAECHHADIYVTAISGIFAALPSPCAYEYPPRPAFPFEDLRNRYSISIHVWL